MDYVAGIRAEIQHHLDEIQKLQTALEVLERMTPTGKGKKAPDPLFTVRRTAPALTTKKGEERDGRTGKRRDNISVIQKVVATIAASPEPLLSADVIETLGFNTSGSMRQRIYAAINAALGRGMIERTGVENKYFRMVTPSLGVADESLKADGSTPQSEPSAEAA